MNEIKLVAHDATNYEIGAAEDLCTDIWDDADPNRPHPVVRVYFCDGDHDREKLIKYILEYGAEGGCQQ